CTSNSPENSASGTQSAEVDDLLGPLNSASEVSGQAKISAYASRIQAAITKKLDQPERYKGKECTIHLLLQRNGRVMAATVNNGDAELCKAAISATARAQIPAAPDEETYHTFSNILIDFRP
ncbi:TPA: cell envelope integrity protein TolA, partial [Raoultella planticola]